MRQLDIDVREYVTHAVPDNRPLDEVATQWASVSGDAIMAPSTSTVEDTSIGELVDDYFSPPAKYAQRASMLAVGYMWVTSNAL